MAKFTPRTTAPTTDNTYYYADNPFYQSGYGMPNCTCYAFGRFWEIAGGSRPSLSWGNAENWWSKSDGYERGQNPKLGSIACWRKGEAGNSSDGAGHVAIVEAINDDGSIVTSDSGWGASVIWWTSNRPNDGNWGAGSEYVFQGFIYNPKTFSTSSVGTTHSRYIWDYFMSKIGNEYGVAGLMGNLQAESGLHPDRVQGDIPYSDYSKEYTAKVDSGEISETDFVNNGPNGGGYGLAQWTYYSRKQALYNMYKLGGYSSIGSIELACDYLWHELSNNYHGVVTILQTAADVKTASDAILHDFERPADQSESVEIARASMGQYWFDLYNGTKREKKKHKELSLLLMWAATRR